MKRGSYRTDGDHDYIHAVDGVSDRVATTTTRKERVSRVLCGEPERRCRAAMGPRLARRDEMP